MCLPCWKFTAATFVGVVFVGRLNFCALNGLPTPVALPTPTGPPAPVCLPAPVGFPPGFETCPVCAPFFCSFFLPSSAPSARDASAILQIKTRNILISFFLLGCWTLLCSYLFNVGALLFGCLAKP